MAYAYPIHHDGSASNTSLGGHSSPAKSTLSRKGEPFDVIREFKVSGRCLQLQNVELLCVCHLDKAIDHKIGMKGSKVAAYDMCRRIRDHRSDVPRTQVERRAGMVGQPGCGCVR